MVLTEPEKPRDLARVAPGLHQLTHYRRSNLVPDGLAALTVWAVVVPQALA